MTIQFGGLATGLDTNNIIDQLMNTRTPADCPAGSGQDLDEQPADRLHRAGHQTEVVHDSIKNLATPTPC